MSSTEITHHIVSCFCAEPTVFKELLGQEDPSTSRSGHNISEQKKETAVFPYPTPRAQLSSGHSLPALQCLLECVAPGDSVS